MLMCTRRRVYDYRKQPWCAYIHYIHGCAARQQIIQERGIFSVQTRDWVIIIAAQQHRPFDWNAVDIWIYGRVYFGSTRLFWCCYVYIYGRFLCHTHSNVFYPLVIEFWPAVCKMQESSLKLEWDPPPLDAKRPLRVVCCGAQWMGRRRMRKRDENHNTTGFKYKF